ncbi:MAG: hypothetical protein GY679_05305 [Mycoplasma sp.]|nr:hypothetical protein [Mycoplasma sp.]
MYQYKAVLKSSKEVVAEGHTLNDIEKEIVRFKRGQKRSEHTNANVGIEIFHVKRDQKTGIGKEDLIKVII